MKEEDFRTARLFKVLGNPLRFKLLQELVRAPGTPSELARLAHRPRPDVSRALQLLQWAGCVEYRTRGHFVVYRLRRPEVAALLHHGRLFIRENEVPMLSRPEAPDLTA